MMVVTTCASTPLVIISLNLQGVPNTMGSAQGVVQEQAMISGARNSEGKDWTSLAGLFTGKMQGAIFDKTASVWAELAQFVRASEQLQGLLHGGFKDVCEDANVEPDQAIAAHQCKEDPRFEGICSWEFLNITSPTDTSGKSHCVKRCDLIADEHHCNADITCKFNAYTKGCEKRGACKDMDSHDCGEADMCRVAHGLATCVERGCGDRTATECTNDPDCHVVEGKCQKKAGVKSRTPPSPPPAAPPPPSAPPPPLCPTTRDSATTGCPAKCHVFADKEELKAAIKAWVDNNEIEKGEFGFPDSWNVSKITDISSSNGGFVDSSFNESIGCWDVSGVTNMWVRAASLPS